MKALSNVTNRRTLLKTLSLGAAGPLLAPLVTRLEAEAAGRKAARVVFFIEGNGLPATHIQPVGITRSEMPNLRNPQVKQSGEDRLVDLPLNGPGVSLPESIAPLSRHLKRLSIIQGLSGRVCGGGADRGEIVAVGGETTEVAVELYLGEILQPRDVARGVGLE